VFISELRIENFRLFGAGPEAFVLELKPGLTALVGENDSGKTAVIDALRLVLGTTDQEYCRVESSDFHRRAADGSIADNITVRCTFDGLTEADQGAFAEYLTYQTREAKAVKTILHVSWLAKRNKNDGMVRRYQSAEWRTGEDGTGPLLDAGARSLLTATYMRPLRDAERAMCAGRGSRLSQILQHTTEIKTQGIGFNPASNPPQNPADLSILGIGDYATYLLGESDSIKGTRSRLNADYLDQLSFHGDPLDARISVNSSSDDGTRLRQLLEKLELSLVVPDLPDDLSARGLGSNNLLFMACELLLLASEDEGFPLLLIEEPEAHLHPQRQLRLMRFLQNQVNKKRADGQQIQIILSTHSPNLAAEIHLDNLVLLRNRAAFPLFFGQTKLDRVDYRFLERFLDVTKANLFFARRVLIVEGDAERILLPELARLINREFEEYGVSVVNVGGVGLRRYANIFLRAQDTDIDMGVRVACVTDLDVMPNCAPSIIGKVKDGEPIPAKRKWRIRGDFSDAELKEHREKIRNKARGKDVETFVSDHWTLEYDLARSGLAEEVWIAAHLADCDVDLHRDVRSTLREVVNARRSFSELKEQVADSETLASHVYSWFTRGQVSKAIAAQYLSEILEYEIRSGRLSPGALLSGFPPYLRGAIEYVTRPAGTTEGVEKGPSN
jgi:putative ATP-dependent endonuclease of OLD family